MELLQSVCVCVCVCVCVWCIYGLPRWLSGKESAYICVCLCECSYAYVLQLLSHALLFEIPWTVTLQAPLSVAYHFLLQGIFLTQRLNLHLLH